MTGARDSLDELYQTRFSDRDRRAKHALWREIGAYLQRWVDPAQPAIDVAADEGYFITNVHASERWATDVRDVSGSCRLASGSCTPPAWTCWSTFRLATSGRSS